MKKFICAVCALLLLFGSSAAMADCVLDGKTYAEGTKIGKHTCTNGAWVETG